MATEIKPQRKQVVRESSIGLSRQGLSPSGEVHWNLIAPELFQAAARRSEGEFADMGPFVAVTAPHTGRSPNDKFIVKEPNSDKDVDWGKVNQP
ncbi:MAG TPA: phosphoenolpyruvate carboxykinase (ATP), partial [Gemmatimonadaceae bacterium]